MRHRDPPRPSRVGAVAIATPAAQICSEPGVEVSSPLARSTNTAALPPALPPALRQALPGAFRAEATAVDLVREGRLG